MQRRGEGRDSQRVAEKRGRHLQKEEMTVHVRHEVVLDVDLRRRILAVLDVRDQEAPGRGSTHVPFVNRVAAFENAPLVPSS